MIFSTLQKHFFQTSRGFKKFKSRRRLKRKFVLITDHRSLLALLGPMSGIPTLAAARMQRWALILSAYNYELHFRKTEMHGNKDMLSLMNFYKKRSELSLSEDVILWVRRMVIPAKFRSKVLEIIHESHAGAVRMKQLAKSYVWWPELDKDIEGLVNKCSNCLQNRNEPPKLKEAEWPIPPTPWTRLHMDFAGPVERPMLFYHRRLDIEVA